MGRARLMEQQRQRRRSALKTKQQNKKVAATKDKYGSGGKPAVTRDTSKDKPKKTVVTRDTSKDQVRPKPTQKAKPASVKPSTPPKAKPAPTAKAKPAAAKQDKKSSGSTSSGTYGKSLPSNPQLKSQSKTVTYSGQGGRKKTKTVEYTPPKRKVKRNRRGRAI